MSETSSSGIGNSRVIGATSGRIPWIPLAIMGVVVAVYMWRTDFEPRWPLILGIVLLCVQSCLRMPFAHRAKGVTVAHNSADTVDIALMYAVFITMVVLPLLRLATPLLDGFDYVLPPYIAAIGVVVMIFGLWLFYRSHADLGKQWSASLQIGEDHRLVTQGVYSRIRHPMYSAIWLMALAHPLLFQNWIAGPPIVLAWAMLYFRRLPHEEAMMVARFGTDYERYRERAGALWPK
ncbi:protein-S-isoprenylcysteine O-methyltransferase [Parasphingopyxis sp.]|uniref:protein-S-isoprenylcysteine O-methyltransferase n=1 Tax=Parasphingopyxis sp. TaxID=1920299 RepID=UPI00260AD81B|nr:protein-S-isoprenylcysteine O-methyltransferase [Parasphingopyxis sp.]